MTLGMPIVTVRRAIVQAVTIVFAGMLLVLGAQAQQRPTYQSLFDAVSKSADCTQQDLVDLLIFTCAKEPALWYFTKPGHPAHPGVIKRYFVQSAQGMNVDEHGWSFASDAAQPAFKTFLAQVSAMDAQMKDAIAAQHGGPPVLDPAVHIYGNWQPRPGDSEAVVSLTRHYFALADAGRYEDSYALLDDSLTRMMAYRAYVDLASQTVTSVGAVKTRAIRTIDWEKNSPLGPPGLYAALDFTAQAERGQLCGFVAWRRQPDGFYVLVREETNIIPASADPAATDALKAKFHCVG